MMSYMYPKSAVPPILASSTPGVWVLATKTWWWQQQTLHLEYPMRKVPMEKTSIWTYLQEHDQHILSILDTAWDNHVWFNPDKFQFKVDQTSFWGLTWTPDGLRVDNLKINAITDTTSPQNLAELQTFMGMVDYLILPHHNPCLRTPTTVTDEERHTLCMATKAPQGFPEC